MARFLAYVINEGKRETDVHTACDVVSKSAATIEDVLVGFLAQKNLTKKPLSMLRDNIVAVERLFELYIVAEKHQLVRVKATARDEEAGDVIDDRISEKLDSFTSDLIIDRLAKRQNILTPFFILLEHIDQVDDDALECVTKILEMFSKRRRGLAHLFRLPYLFVINKVWQDKAFERRADKIHDDLEQVFKTITQKFFESAQRDRTLFLEILTNVDQDDVYDEEAERRRQEEIASQRMGISQEILSILGEKPAPASDDEMEPPVTYYQRHSDHEQPVAEPQSPVHRAEAITEPQSPVHHAEAIAEPQSPVHRAEAIVEPQSPVHRAEAIPEPSRVSDHPSGSDVEKPSAAESGSDLSSSDDEKPDQDKPENEAPKALVLTRETQEDSDKGASGSGDDLELEDDF